MLLYSLKLHALKLMKEYKHVRFKTIDFSNALKVSHKVLHNQRSELLCDLFNCNIHTAREIVAKNNDIVELSQQDFERNAKFCCESFKLSDVIEYPWVLTLQPSLFQHRYYSLKELGFRSVTPYYVLRFSFILKETPKTLEEKGFPVDCKHKSDILAKYLNEAMRPEINNNLQCMYNDGSNLQKIKEVMNAEYFSAKLECPIGKAYQMFKNYGFLRVQSIYNTDQLLNILLWRFGLPVSKIYSYLNVLSIHHETVTDFITEVPEILGVDTVYLIKRFPSLLRHQIDSLRKVEGVLKDFNITKEQLICCLRVLLIAPDTLRNRLSTICSTEEFAVLQSNKKFLWLVYNFKNLNSRLKCLKNEKMPCSINMFTVPKNTFDKYIIYNNTRTNFRESYVYLANVFKVTEKEISSRLHRYFHSEKEIRNFSGFNHQKFIEVHNFSAFNCQKVIEFLLLSGVTKEQIFNGLEIIFYDIDIVKKHFKNFRQHHACQPFEEWTSHFNLIQLLIYFIQVIKYHTFEKKNYEQDDFIQQSEYDEQDDFIQQSLL